MKKRFSQILIAIATLGCATMFAADLAQPAISAKEPSHTREQIFAERKAKRATASTKAKAPSQTPRRINGGTNSDKPLFGLMYFSYSDYFYEWYGILKIDADCNHTPVKPFGSAPFSGVYYDNNFLLIDYSDASSTVNYITYDATTWEKTDVDYRYPKTTTDILPYALAYDPTTQSIYGIVIPDATRWTTSDPRTFCKIDLQNAGNPIVKIAEPSIEIVAMAASADGTLYAIDTEAKLYSINKFTAEATHLQDLDLPFAETLSDLLAKFHFGMVSDYETNDLYLSYGDGFNNCYIVRIDPATGNVTILADTSYDEETYEGATELFCSLYFEQQASATATGPAAVSNLQVTPAGVEPKANVSFALPSVDSDGNILKGNVDWIITDGNNELASGSASKGSNVITQVSFSSTGLNRVVVFASINGKQSIPMTANVFVGADTPVMSGIPSARANLAGDKITISWNAATAANGGNFEADVTYSLTRMPDNVVVNNAVSDTKYVDDITSDTKTLYHYIVTPNAGSVSGEPLTSRSTYAGKYFPVPYTDDFTDANLFLQYPVIDANNDEHTWDIAPTKFNKGAAYYESNSNNADDYLLIGPFKATAGTSYTFFFTADGHSATERVAAYAGTDPDDVTSFTTELVPPTSVIPSNGESSFESVYDCTADCDLYFAIKACSGSYHQYLYIYDIRVGSIDATAPEAPSNLTVTPGVSSATIEFDVPSTNIDGTPANSITAVSISRDGTLIKTLTAEDDNVTAGAHMTYVDNDEVSDGLHTYSVAAHNPIGQGKSISAQAWRGIDYPGTPRNLRIWEDLETSGLIHITFDHPEYGYNGGFTDPDNTVYLIDYLVLGGESGLIELGTGTEHTFRLQNAPVKQTVLAGSVYGRNSMGDIRTTWSTKSVTIGPAEAIPFCESWPGRTPQRDSWTGQSVDDGTEFFSTLWEARDGVSSGITPQDADGGMLSMSTSAAKGSRGAMTPRMTLKGAKEPTMVFYYRYKSSAISLALSVIDEDKPQTTIMEFNLDPAECNKWIRVEIPLTQYADSKYVQFIFTGCGSNSQDVICIDNFSVTDYMPYDLTVTDFTAPVKTDINSAITLTAKLRNNGANTADEGKYSVVLHKNGNAVQTVSPEAIEASATATVVFTDIPSVTDPETCEYYVEVLFEADGNTADNISLRRSVRVITPDYPTVTDLAAVIDNGVRLTWSDPNTSAMPGTPVTESFENYQSYIYDNIGNWTVYDEDKCVTVVLAMDLAGPLDYPNIGSPMAWQVIDPADAGIFGNAWYPRTGNKMLVSFQACVNNTRLVECNDWLVSPELDGSSQKISFYATSGMNGAYTPEIFDFMVSTTGNAIEDFSILSADVEVPYCDYDWQEFSFNVPEGTRYFAIVHKSYNKVAMLIDDITYIPAGSQPIRLELQGFNVYRNGDALNTELIADNEFTDTTGEDGKQYTYHVTPVWDKGESGLSNPVQITYSASISEVSAESGVSITGLNRAIRISGLHGTVRIYDTMGVCVAKTMVNGTADIPVAARGIYIAKAGTTAVKVIVRQ